MESLPSASARKWNARLQISAGGSFTSTGTASIALDCYPGGWPFGGDHPRTIKPYMSRQGLAAGLTPGLPRLALVRRLPRADRARWAGLGRT
jgi:hypothetical protein